MSGFKSAPASSGLIHGLFGLYFTADVPEKPIGGEPADEAGLRASWQGRLLDLTPIEFRLLRTLAANPGHVHAFDLESGDRLNDKPVVSA